MVNYEMMFIVKTTMEADKAKEVANLYGDLIKQQGGTVSNLKEMGQKKLAYSIKNQTNGYYYVLTFEGTPEVISELDRKIKIDENIIRHLIVKVEE